VNVNTVYTLFTLPKYFHIITGLRALHATQSSHEKAICPSVKHVICDKMKESCAHILIPHERSFTLVLCQEEWLVRVIPSS